MSKYLEPTDEGAFDDYPLKDPLEAYNQGDVECPKCKGHGGWNLELNAYPLRDRPDTPENRHKFCHFRASCGNCYGHGYVNPEQGNHIHEWTWVKKTGNCLNLWECKECGKKWEIDSSD